MPDIPCPHCGQLNENQRDVCWACCKLMNGKDKPARKVEILGIVAEAPMEPPTPGALFNSPFLSGMSLFIRILFFSLIPYAVVWLWKGSRTVRKGTDTRFFCMAVNLFGVMLIWAS